MTAPHDNAGLFDVQGELTNQATRKFLEEYMQAFAGWGERHR